ncbi:uncharacterized protein [Thunnus thynnus]|uniref:uncharacterized protein n=1 Tax=Thunnus thynnus TaxID=8237 RepID=UPI0035277B27
MIILIPVLFLDMFNIIINFIYDGIIVDLTWMYILIAIFGVILVGFIIIIIYLTFKHGNRYLIWNVIYLAPCILSLFNIIIFMYKAINEDLTWMFYLTAVFGVILVGCIIAIIYLKYKDTSYDLKWMLLLIAVCIPVVFNIINSLYRAVRGGLTWMIILTAIFGVILVGCIISIIIMYLRYRARFWTLKWTFMLTALCISGVCNIINLIYKGRKGDLTWMFNFIPVCMLVGFIIIIIYLIYKGITFLRRKRREDEAAERDWQERLERFDMEMSEMLPPVQNTPTQDPTSVVVQNPSNGTEMSKMLPPVQNTSTQDPTSVVVQDTSNGTEMSKMLPPVQNTSTQDPTSVVVQDTSNGTEMLEMLPLKKTFPQDTTSTGPAETSKETEKSAIIPDVPETCRLLMDEQTADPEDETQS